MSEMFNRSIPIYGEKGMEKLKNCHVAIFGIGGVGSAALEALVRSGIGTVTLVDKDTVDITNINRQIIATTATVGKIKVDVAKERILEINPEIKVYTESICYSQEVADIFLWEEYDYVVDAIDMVSSKTDLLIRCKYKNIPVISAMGTGNKTDPTRLEVTDIYKTSACPLAKIIRQKMRKAEISDLKVVYSTELPVVKTTPPSSTAFVPPVAGMMMAAEVVRDILALPG
jgi:tRNA A37 threonylcarbamoyladenosine dehydratase